MEKAIRWTAGGIAMAMSLYHMWFAASAPPEAMIFRGTHLLFALTLVFILFLLRAGAGPLARMADFALMALGWGAVLHIFLNYQTFTNRNENGSHVLGSGSGTNLSGGTIPTQGGIVIHFSRMNRILEIDIENQRAVVEPGVFTLALKTALGRYG